MEEEEEEKVKMYSQLFYFLKYIILVFNIISEKNLNKYKSHKNYLF